LITGAGSGLGRALALELARRGATPVLCDRSGAGLNETADLVRELGASCSVAVLDVREVAAVRGWVERQERIDCLFNNAGIRGPGGLTDRYAPSDWAEIIDVNLKGVVHGVHAGFSFMARQGFGHIVNTASLAGLLPLPLALPYSAMKHAVVGISRSLRPEAAARGLRVSALCPGAVRTPILTSGRLRGCEHVSEERVLASWERRMKPMVPSSWARPRRPQRGAHRRPASGQGLVGGISTLPRRGRASGPHRISLAL